MRKPEQRFYDWLVEGHALPGHVVRVENSAGAGQGDVNLCYEGNELWLELKCGDPKKLTELLRPSQKAWHQLRCRQGGRVLVLVRHRDEVTIFRANFSKDVDNRYLHLFSTSERAVIRALITRELNGEVSWATTSTT